MRNVLIRIFELTSFFWFPDKIPPEKKSPGKNPSEKIPLNTVEREPVPTRVLNPNASEASFKPKQRSYRKMWGGDFPGWSIPRNIFLGLPEILMPLGTIRA